MFSFKMDSIDLKKCFLCQSEDTNDLSDPPQLRGKSNENYKPYGHFAANILELKLKFWWLRESNASK